MSWKLAIIIDYQSYAKAFEVVMSSLDNKFCEANWYLDFGVNHHVTRDKNVLDLMNHNFTAWHVKSIVETYMRLKEKIMYCDIWF
jgi:hypothetical protein